MEIEQFLRACAKPITPLFNVVTKVFFGQIAKKVERTLLSVKVGVWVRENTGLEFITDNANRDFVWVQSHDENRMA